MEEDKVLGSETPMGQDDVRENLQDVPDSDGQTLAGEEGNLDGVGE